GLLRLAVAHPLLQCRSRPHRSVDPRRRRGTRRIRRARDCEAADPRSLQAPSRTDHPDRREALHRAADHGSMRPECRKLSKPSSTIWPRSRSMMCLSDCGRAPAASPGSSCGWICATDRPPGSPRWSGPRGRDVLVLEELLDPDLSALTAETLHLHTSEG